MKKKLNVLAVDDNEDVRILVSKWLGDEGYSIKTAVDGNDCIRKLTKDLDIVLLDIMMPGPTIKTILEAIRKKSPNAIVIYLTAVESFAPTKEQIKKGWTPMFEPPVMGYIQKPIDKRELLDKIKDSLNMKKVIWKDGNKKTS